MSALVQDEPLIFEMSAAGRCGVDWPEIELDTACLGKLERDDLSLPDLSEPQVVRHYTRLSQKNYGIDTGFYPLGSCTMKHNPRLNEKVARYFSTCHPLQPFSTCQGSLEVIFELSQWLMELTGMSAVAMSPAAGAQGELCGMMMIRAAIMARPTDSITKRHVVLVPDSAHGTNPATAAACGFEVRPLKSNAQGRVDMDSFYAALDDSVAAIMLTNPNTCGLFEKDIKEIADAIHKVGGYFYCDGANFNAIVGRVRPSELGVDCMHINLHKTFSTPHGGGGPGSGPVVLAESLAPFAPLPFVVKDSKGFKLIETVKEAPSTIGRLKGFHGQMGMFIRALAYMKSHGIDGLQAVSGDAVLNANYLLGHLKECLNLPFPAPCMHEVLFDDQTLKALSISTLDFAKALIDKGFHPMTMYFPLVVSGALLMEPTETESKETLDQFIEAVKDLFAKAQQGEKDIFENAPLTTPIRRLDETLAARKPLLRWNKV